MADLGSTILGAVVGGAISLTTTLVTLRSNHKAATKQAEREDSRDASATLAGAMARAHRMRTEFKTNNGWEDSVTDLAVSVARDLGRVEESADLAGRVRRALSLLEADTGLIAAARHLNTEQSAQLQARWVADVEAYPRWVIRCLSEVAAGRAAPLDVPGPALLEEWKADPWQEPT